MKMILQHLCTKRRDMISFIVLGLLCVSGSFGSPKKTTPSEDPGKRTDADIKDFPYQLSLAIETYIPFAKPRHICGASIINPSWALSAAHCFDLGLLQFMVKSYVIRAGSNSTDGGGYHPVVKYIIHPNYNDSISFDYDVCVIKVCLPFNYSATVVPIALADAKPSNGTEAVITGWGATSFWNVISLSHDKHLQKVTVNVSKSSECECYHRRQFTPNMLCVSRPQSDNYVGKGDDGGPVVVDGKQIGIVSYIPRVIIGSVPTMCTDVAFVRDWILSAIEG